MIKGLVSRVIQFAPSQMLLIQMSSLVQEPSAYEFGILLGLEMGVKATPKVCPDALKSHRQYGTRWLCFRKNPQCSFAFEALSDGTLLVWSPS